MAFNPPTEPRAMRPPPAPTAPATFGAAPEPAATPEKIQPLKNLAPSIFVPLREEHLERHAEPARDRVERLHRILESIDHQRAGVRDNLVCLFEREKQRIIAEATEREAQLGGPPKIRPGLPPDETDAIITCMEAPAQTGVDYDVKAPDLPPLDIHRPLPPGLSVREKAVEDLMSLVEGSVGQLTGFEAHIAGVMQHYLDW